MKRLALFGIASIAIAVGAASSTVAMGQQGDGTIVDAPLTTAGDIGSYDAGAGDFGVFVDAFAETDPATTELVGASLAGTGADTSADVTFAHEDWHEHAHDHGSFSQLMTEWMGACLLYKDDVLAGATWTKTDSGTTLDATADAQVAHQSDGGWYDGSETKDWESKDWESTNWESKDWGTTDWGTKDSETHDWGSNNWESKDWGSNDWGRTP